MPKKPKLGKGAKFAALLAKKVGSGKKKTTVVAVKGKKKSKY